MAKVATLIKHEIRLIEIEIVRDSTLDLDYSLHLG
jgi:hypothetical protein